MADVEGTGGGASGRRFAAVMGAIVVVGLLALGAAWWFLDEVVERNEGEARRKAADSTVDRPSSGGK